MYEHFLLIFNTNCCFALIPWFLFCVFSAPPAVILISVEYCLAPEYPFPAAIIDALTVINYLMESNPTAKIHISGVSSGGHIALVSGMETFRKFPHQLAR